MKATHQGLGVLSCIWKRAWFMLVEDAAGREAQGCWGTDTWKAKAKVDTDTILKARKEGILGT